MRGKNRIIMAKLGLDSHDNGLRIVSKWLADSGYEVIYAGVYNSEEHILKMAIEESADAVGVSFLGGEHLHYARRLLELFRANGLKRVKLFVGGIIPPDDVVALQEMGVDAIFTPGARRDQICMAIDESFDSSEERINEG